MCIIFKSPSYFVEKTFARMAYFMKPYWPLKLELLPPPPPPRLRCSRGPLAPRYWFIIRHIWITSASTRWLHVLPQRNSTWNLLQYTTFTFSTCQTSQLTSLDSSFLKYMLPIVVNFEHQISAQKWVSDGRVVCYSRLVLSHPIDSNCIKLTYNVQRPKLA